MELKSFIWYLVNLCLAYIIMDKSGLTAKWRRNMKESNDKIKEAKNIIKTKNLKEENL